jgi:hypothetical protein
LLISNFSLHNDPIHSFVLRRHVYKKIVESNVGLIWNELTNSCKEESNKEERQVPLSVANIQTDSLCADEHRSRGESSDCQRATFLQMSVGSHVDCYHCTTPTAMEQGRDRNLRSMENACCPHLDSAQTQSLVIMATPFRAARTLK